MTLKWISNDYIIYSENIVSYVSDKVKVAGFDLDHTLIRPNGKRTHPKDKNDYEYVFPNIIEKMKKLHYDGFSILIFSNQDDLNKKPEKKDIVLSRIQRLWKEVFDNHNIPLQVFISIGRDFCRKPNTGMLDFFLSLHKIKLHKTSFYVGDAAGRTKTTTAKKDFSCSDRMFASNCKMNFMTPEQFFDEDDHRAYIMDNTALTMFMKEDTEGTMEKAIIPYNDIKTYDIVMIMGPQGSGKSYLSSKLVKKYGFTDIVSFDNCRTKAKCLRMYQGLLKLDDKKIILDNTHSKKSSRKEYLDKLPKDKKILLIKINVDKTQSFFLDNFRCKANKTKRFPDVVIHSYFKFYEEPDVSEGFDRIIEIPFIPNFKGKPKLRELFYQYY